MNVTVNVTGSTADLAILGAALAEGADRRRRTGIAAAAELQADRAAGVDVAAQGLLVLDVLAEADVLDRYAKALTAAAAQPAAAAPPVPDPLADALAKATAAVQAARGNGALPTAADLAAGYNAAHAPTTVDGAVAWVAPGIDDDDDEPDAEGLLTLDMQP